MGGTTPAAIAGPFIDISWPEMPVTVEKEGGHCSCVPRKRLVSFQGGDAGFRDPTHDETSPEKVADEGKSMENPLISGKSRWVKSYYLARKFSHDKAMCFCHLDPFGPKSLLYIFIQGFLMVQ